MALLTAKALGLTVVGASGSEERVKCPFHSDMHSSASFNVAKQLFYCHTCKTGFNVRTLLSKLGLDVDEELIRISDTPTEFVFDIFLDDPTRLFANPFKEEEALSNPTSRTVWDYLSTKRGLWYDTICEYCEYTSRPLGPLFPIIDLSGTRVGGLMRPIDTTFGKYILVGQRTPIWPLNEIQYEHQTLVLVEGMFSCLALRQMSIKMGLSLNELGIYAMLGSTVMPKMFEVVDQVMSDDVWFCFDRDSAGFHGAKMTQKQRPAYRATVLSPSADDMTEKQLIRFLEKVTK